jgi:hypothetical protein
MVLVTKKKARFARPRSLDRRKIKKLVKRNVKYQSWRHWTAEKTFVWQDRRLKALRYEPDNVDMIAFAKPIVQLPKAHNIGLHIKYNTVSNEQFGKSSRSTFKRRVLISSSQTLSFFLNSRLSGTRIVPNKNYLKLRIMKHKLQINMKKKMGPQHQYIPAFKYALSSKFKYCWRIRRRYRRRGTRNRKKSFLILLKRLNKYKIFENRDVKTRRHKWRRYTNTKIRARLYKLIINKMYKNQNKIFNRLARDKNWIRNFWRIRRHRRKKKGFGALMRSRQSINYAIRFSTIQSKIKILKGYKKWIQLLFKMPKKSITRKFLFNHVLMKLQKTLIKVQASCLKKRFKYLHTLLKTPPSPLQNKEANLKIKLKRQRKQFNLIRFNKLIIRGGYCRNRTFIFFEKYQIAPRRKFNIKFMEYRNVYRRNPNFWKLWVTKKDKKLKTFKGLAISSICHAKICTNLNYQIPALVSTRHWIFVKRLLNKYAHNWSKLVRKKNLTHNDTLIGLKRFKRYYNMLYGSARNIHSIELDDISWHQEHGQNALLFRFRGRQNQNRQIPWFQALISKRSLYSLQFYNMLRRETPVFKTKRNKVYRTFLHIAHNRFRKIQLKPQKRGGNRSIYFRLNLLRTVLPIYWKFTTQQLKKAWSKFRWVKSRFVSRNDLFSQRLDFTLCSVIQLLNWAPNTMWAYWIVKHGGVYVSSLRNKADQCKLHNRFPLLMSHTTLTGLYRNKTKPFDTIRCNDIVHINPKLKAFILKFFHRRKKNWHKKPIAPALDHNSTGTAAVLNTYVWRQFGYNQRAKKTYIKHLHN